MRGILGVSPDQLMVLTVGGDAASKGGREVMEALARVRAEVPDFRYVCKVWPQPRTEVQNALDLELARELGMEDRVSFPTHRVSRDLMPYLMAACDVYAAPSRLEGFGMPQVEAGACGKPVIGIRAMAMLDTLVRPGDRLPGRRGPGEHHHRSGAGPRGRLSPRPHVIFDRPRVADYRASVPDIADALRLLLNDPGLRQRMGAAGRARAVARFDFRLVARQLVDILSDHLGVV